MTIKLCAFYARVSSERQAQSGTIGSQISALEKRIQDDGGKIPQENKFIDNGCSGATLIRPALEQLRDRLAIGDIDQLYVHSPDRLSRKYAYQMILIEEFKSLNVDIIFLNCEMSDNPESHLLLQMQGMIAEYERAKIMERNRRGKIHSAKRGSVNVLGTAPYGYRYIDKHSGGGQAMFVVQDEEAVVVQRIFNWVGQDRLSIGEVCRRLFNDGIETKKGKKKWDRSVIWAMLKNPTYKGEAAFGKTKIGKLIPQIRPQKHSQEYSKKGYSIHPVAQDQWITIAVPAIIDAGLFDLVQEQLQENKKLARTRRRGASYLLQGLIVCARCKYAYYGKPVRNKRGEKVDEYAYYRCIGTDAYRFGGQRICDNKQIRTDTLETAVWEEVKLLLNNPERVLHEYQRRLHFLENTPNDKDERALKKQYNKLQKSLERLIDSYTDGIINKAEFEPRILSLRQRLEDIEQQRNAVTKWQEEQREIQLIITNFMTFTAQVYSATTDINWETKRSIIRALVKRVEIDAKEVNIVFKVNINLPPDLKVKWPCDEVLNCLQDCCRGN